MLTEKFLACYPGHVETTSPKRGRPLMTPDQRVHRIQISIPPEDWRRIQAVLPEGERSGAALAGLLRACEERERMK